MERLFGHDFTNVRVHRGAVAAESARAISALAYTVGSDVVLGAGQGDPAMFLGRRVLAHELAHVAQQATAFGPAGVIGDLSAETEAEVAARHAEGITSGDGPPRLSHHPVGVQRAPLPATSAPAAPAPAAQAGMTRAAFEKWLHVRFRTRVVTGTEEQQARELTPRTGAPAGGITLPGWRPWDPGASSPYYQTIIDTIEDFAQAIGGVPELREVVFYNVDYEVNPAGVAVAQPEHGAAYGAGRLTIWQAATTSDKGLPVARSNVAGRYPPVVLGLTGIPGQTPGAPIPYVPREQSQRRILAHEFGHGLAEAAMAADPATFEDFRKAVGWTLTEPAELYDVQARGVAAAIASKGQPPAGARITEGNWNSPTFGEQPLTNYAVTGGPGEDFAEAVMAFIYAPELLSKRSPARYVFLAHRLDQWRPRLTRLPQVGDFPVPGRERPAARALPG